MCGIAGVMGRADGAVMVGCMTALLSHRGPDGVGQFAGDNIALGHTRLAILDLSPAGRQPMISRDGRWIMVMNGEIFNYIELGAQLGVRFRSGSDTEVLLEACAAWGIETALERSHGMFAFALWDTREQELTLARDRVGEKPLVYFREGATLAFSSELKALRPFHRGQLDPGAVDVYLALGYVPAPLAIFRGVHKLPAGHLMRWKNGTVDVQRWWFPERVTARAGLRRHQRIEELRALVADAVRLRLRADVPVALSLSGGLDSSVIAAELRRQGARPDAFTVVFDGDETDLPYARRMAQQLQLSHQVIRAEAGGVVRQLDRAVKHYDEPFADSSALASLALGQALAGRYKVILNGDGGDEAFGGYRHYEFIGAKQWLKGAAAAAGLCDGAGRTGVYVQSKTTFRRSERAGLLNGRASGDTLAGLLSSDPFRPASVEGALRHALWSDRHLYLANNLTYKMDLALAAHGIEGRAPFLDHRILEWAQDLKAGDLVRGRNKKVLLRAAYREELPPEVTDRPKHGFGAPVGAWLEGPLAELARESVPCPLLQPELQKNVAGQRLWTLLTLARWSRAWGASW